MAQGDITGLYVAYGGCRSDDVDEDILEDVESNYDSAAVTSKSIGTDSDDDASISHAKGLAREKFEWLTSHALVAAATGTGTANVRERSRSPSVCNTLVQRRSSGNGATAGAADSDEDHAAVIPRGDVEGKQAMLDHRMASPGSFKSAATYLAACARYSLTPNGGALLCLSLGLEMLEVDGTMSNLELVPLCAALLDAPFVLHLKLSGHPLQDTGAAVLALALPGCPWIRELELVGCKITGAGTKSICDALRKSNVWRLVLRRNILRQNAALANPALAMAVERAKHLTCLDLQSSGLSSQGMRMIKRALGERAHHNFAACNVNFEGNFVLVEILNSVTHGVCAIFCVEGWRRLHFLIIRLCHWESRIAVTLYIASMLAMFVGSTLYHSTFAVTELSWFFRMIDHCAIYFLIAGTYTPVLVMGCRDVDTMKVHHGVIFWTGIYWFLVALGTVMELIFSPRKPAWYGKFILVMYVVLGFGGVPYIATCPLVQKSDVMVWVELGGATYVIGIVFFLLDKRYPAMHVVWHILVGLAAFIHFLAVWNLTNEVIDHTHSCENPSIWGTGLPFMTTL